MTPRRALLRIGIVAMLVSVPLMAGAAYGVGPLARVTPTAQVTDPREIVARSLQAVIDASSVHVETALAGTIPGALVGRPGGGVQLDGTRATLDVRPQDARSRLDFASPVLATHVESISSWDTLAYRIDGGAWARGSVADVAAATGISIDPLTVVDQARTWLAAPGAPVPSVARVACDVPSGVCREVTLSLGAESGALLRGLFPGDASADLGSASVSIVLLADAQTLRPAHLRVSAQTADGSLAATLEADFTNWDGPSVIPDPPGG